MQMPDKKKQTTRTGTAPQYPGKTDATAAEKTYLNHGVETLVAKDNPDDSQLGAGGGPTKAPRRA
jgi:hypothetical protein